jgi:hypothetical protein
MLYWVAAIKEPTKKQRDEEDAVEILIMQPKIVVAKDDKSAAINVVVDAEELKGRDLTKIQVVVRPF